MSSKIRQNLWWPAFCVVFIICSFLITGEIRSGGGLDVNDHPTPLPSHVIKLDNSNYLLSSSAPLGGDTICWGVDNNADPPVVTDKQVPAIHGRYIRCSLPQTWNVHKPKAWNYGEGLSHTILNPYFDYASVILFSLSWLPFIVLISGDLRTKRRNAKLLVVTSEDKRRELRISFAKGEIDESEFENGLNRIYNIKGIKREKDDASGDPFKT